MTNRQEKLRRKRNETCGKYDDSIGQRRFLIEPEGGRFTTAYDDAGRIRFLVNPQNYRTTWSYDAADRVKVQYLGNSTRASYSYDDANRLLKLANIRSDATTISSFDDAYDAVGNRTRVVEANGVRVTWNYDNKYQLTRERRNGGNAYDITYSYDAAANRRVKFEDAIRTTYAYDSANQLRYHDDNTGRTTYTFDANGNQRIVKSPSGSLTTNTWDYENKLTKVILPSGTRNTFAYDADGKRVKKEDSSGTSKFIWDAENILVETNATDVIQAVYSQEPVVYGNLISQYRSAATGFFHFDALGSTDRLTDSSGTVSDNYVYEAFGVIKSSSGSTTNQFKYVGRLGYFHNADLLQYYLRARQYEPELGRFLSRDPRAWDRIPIDADHEHSYVYVMHRPINLADASGLAGVCVRTTVVRSALSIVGALPIKAFSLPAPTGGGSQMVTKIRCFFCQKVTANYACTGCCIPTVKRWTFVRHECCHVDMTPTKPLMADCLGLPVPTPSWWPGVIPIPDINLLCDWESDVDAKDGLKECSRIAPCSVTTLNFPNYSFKC